MSGPLPAGGSGSDDARGGSGPEGQPPRSEMPALRDVNIPTTSRLPVRYTLGGGMTQALVLPAAAERVGQDGKSDSPAPRETGRPWPLVPLYISTTALQMLDVVSTQRALAAGGSEANPFVAPLVGSTPTMVAVKAGVSGAMIYAVEHLWKQNRKAAILMLLGTNIGYAVVVAHNFALTTSAPPTR